MDYNTSRKKLIMREYGRNVQEMVVAAVKIEDRAERSQAVHGIVDYMGRMYPYLRDLRDFKHKLWDHVAIMSDYQLDIDAPYELPTAETFAQPPMKVPYSVGKPRKKHYGQTVFRMIEHALTLTEGEERNNYIGQLANHMKKSYMIWNKDNVDDSLIFKDLYELSNGKIEIPAHFKLTTQRDFMQAHAYATQQNQNQKRKKRRKK